MNAPHTKPDSQPSTEHGDETVVAPNPAPHPLAVLTRREVLFAAAGTVAVAAAGAWFFFDEAAQTELTPEQDVAWRIRIALSYLNLDLQGLETFALMYVKWLPAQPRQPNNVQADMVERYLKSTDFFPNGADESRLVQYVGFYDPYLIPCNLPFAPKVTTL